MITDIDDVDSYIDWMDECEVKDDLGDYLKSIKNQPTLQLQVKNGMLTVERKRNYGSGVRLKAVQAVTRFIRKTGT